MHPGTVNRKQTKRPNFEPSKPSCKACLEAKSRKPTGSIGPRSTVGSSAIKTPAKMASPASPAADDRPAPLDPNNKTPKPLIVLVSPVACDGILEDASGLRQPPYTAPAHTPPPPPPRSHSNKDPTPYLHTHPRPKTARSSKRETRSSRSSPQPPARP